MNTTYTIAFALLIPACGTAADPAGYTPIMIQAPHHNKEMSGAIYYPSGGGGTLITYAENPVFQGMTVAEGAQVAEGTHPVVMLSHGMGGNIRALAWLATGLAEQGAVVVAVNHPNSTWGDFDIAASLNHWTRAQDLTLALDSLLADPRFAGQLDATRVMAAGFSFGGWTALSLGGVRGDHAGYIAHCESYGAASSHCDDMIGAQVKMQDTDTDAWNASYADPRITRVTAIDPGFVWGLSGKDISDLVTDVRLVGLGDGNDRLLAADFHTSGFGDLLPDAQVDHIVPAFHFTAMPLCKPAGPAILIEENDDPVCTDPEGTDRAAVHALIIENMARDLGL